MAKRLRGTSRDKRLNAQTISRFDGWSLDVCFCAGLTGRTEMSHGSGIGWLHTVFFEGINQSKMLLLAVGRLKRRCLQLLRPGSGAHVQNLALRTRDCDVMLVS